MKEERSAFAGRFLLKNVEIYGILMIINSGKCYGKG